MKITFMGVLVVLGAVLLLAVIADAIENEGNKMGKRNERTKPSVQ
jgi:hypothetical protein